MEKNANVRVADPQLRSLRSIICVAKFLRLFSENEFERRAVKSIAQFSGIRPMLLLTAQNLEFFGGKQIALGQLSSL